MKKIDSINQVKKEHEHLYRLLMKEGKNIKHRNNFLMDAESLIQTIEKLSSSTKSFEDYLWLNDSAIKWQSALSTYCNIPRNIHISLPDDDLTLQNDLADRVLLEHELDDIVTKHAQYTAYWRIRDLGRQSTQEEIERDKIIAEEALAAEILDGKINFSSRISPDSYWRLEIIWLREIKLLNAYFIALRSNSNNNPADPKKNFHKASEHLRNLLVDPGIKAMPNEFHDVKKYLQKRYIKNNGKLDTEKPETKILISKKASRIAERDNNEKGIKTDDVKNWLEAETYVEMFYENIIPAVELNDEESILTVLKSFQFSKAIDIHYDVVNCFEAVIAIYYLSPNVIQSLWDNSEKHEIPISSIESIVKCEDFPTNFYIPHELAHCFHVESGKLLYMGVMKEEEKRLLEDNLKSYTYDIEKYLSAIEQLFEQSRLIHKETTF